MPTAILSIDQGTTNSKAVLINSAGKIIGSGSAPVDIEFPAPGWVQQDAEAIWASVVSAIGTCFNSAPDAEIVGLGISNQRETVVAWDRKSGTPSGPAISWQCRRTTDTTLDLKQAGVEAEILEATGLPLDPLFPASKIRWLWDNAPERSGLCVGTIDSWLIYKLTNGQSHVTDRSNASRTQLFSLKSGGWDPDLCRIFGIDSSILPEVRDSQSIFGSVSGVPNLPDGLPIASAIGDSHAALFGHAAYRPGDCKVTFGTGSSVMVATDSFTKPKDGLTTTVAWSRDGQMTYALEGNILVSASIFPWAADLLGLDGDVGALMDLAQSVEDAEGAFLVPAHVGLGAPHWQPEATGLITGLRFSTKPAHIARAAAESMALQVADVLEAVETGDVSIGSIHVDGGPSENPFLMQIVSDVLGKRLKVCRMPEVSAFGAATLAGLQLGIWADLGEVAAIDRGIHQVPPAAADTRVSRLREGWARAIRQTAL